TWRDRVDTAIAVVRAAPGRSAAVAAAVAVVGLVAILFFHHPQPRAELQLPRADAAPAAGASPPTTTGELVVDVAGAVIRPGVVRLAGPGRAIDAIGAAGG